MKANERQVGGDHYGLRELQHWDLVDMFDWDYYQGQIIKYVMRWRDKNGIQDLEKAAHFLEKYIELAKRREGKVDAIKAGGIPVRPESGGREKVDSGKAAHPYQRIGEPCPVSRTKGSVTEVCILDSGHPGPHTY